MKWIFRYLKGTISHGIMFGSHQGDPSVLGFSDSDYVGGLDDREVYDRTCF
uniref:Retrovirus-related Pol polyprotein from transposon TNT 1-94 n=1 Tax=Cajanus cajan TaxID=3821 RepID=A0A151SBY7_CAJCA|nr:hypothetical protein KK1_025863 [Cajanus cajan]